MAVDVGQAEVAAGVFERIDFATLMFRKSAHGRHSRQQAVYWLPSAHY